MQAIAHSDPAGRLITDARGLDHDVLVLGFQGLLQLIFKLVLGILPIVDLMHNVTVCGRQAHPWGVGGGWEEKEETVRLRSTHRTSVLRPWGEVHG